MDKHKNTESQSHESDENTVNNGIKEQDALKPKKTEIGHENETEEFTELEKSRMDSPPKHREENGSEKHNNDDVEESNQSNGI